MTDSPTQHALREMRRIFSLPLAQIILVAVVVLLGISGPFGTLDNLNFGPRLAYWAFTVPVTFGVGVLSSSFVAQAMRAVNSIWAIRFSVALSTSVLVGITVAIINWLAFENIPLGFARFVTQFLPVMATAGVIALVFHYIDDAVRKKVVPAHTPSTLLERLDLNKRGALISMSVQDHYVEVTTTAGTSLLLMRLSDAMRETGTNEGLQVHRSHWVAKRHVTAAQRDGDKAILTLSDGRTLPASRSHIKALKDAGILPR